MPPRVARLVRRDHFHERDAPAQARRKVRLVGRFCKASPVSSRCCRIARRAADFATTHGRFPVDDDARDAHGRALLEHARFLFVNCEPFVFGDVPDPGQEITGKLRGIAAAVGREREIVGVTRVTPAELNGDSRQTRIPFCGPRDSKATRRLVQAPCGKARGPVATWNVRPAYSTVRRGASVQSIARIVAAAGEYPSCLKRRRTRVGT